MTDFTYIPTDPPPRPFAKGDMVEVLDREHNVLSRQKVTRARATIRTECGRKWTQDGCWIGDFDVWPFPSIRLVL